MKINDEGTSNAAHWHERAMKAEARLAEAEALLREARDDVVEAMNRTHKPHTMTYYRDQLASIAAFLAGVSRPNP